MKKGLVLLICVSLLGGLCGRVCAQQQGVRHFENGDYVTISFFENETQYYMTASSSGVGTSDVAKDDCLWRVVVPPQSDTAEILLQDVLTDYYLQIDVDYNNPWGAIAMQLTNNVDLATHFRFYEQQDTRYKKSWEEGKYRYGRLYSKHTTAHGLKNVYVGNTWNNGVTFGANLWNTSIVYIEKWEKKGDPVGYFAPSKIEFTYDKEKTAGVPKYPATQEVQFYFPTEVASYWECINRPDEIKLKRENTAVDFSDVEPTIYWASNRESVSWINPTDFVNEPDAREVLKIVNKGNAAFTVQTVGDIVWDLKWNGYGTDQWVDYADNVVVEYEYNGKTYKSSMRVVRKSYHKEEMPSLVFSINPVTYTFAKEKETKPFAITISHQHGEVIYNMDHQAIRTNYEEGPDIIPLNDQNWTLSWTPPIPNWLSIGNVTERNVAVTTEANGTGTKRSYVLKGTFSRKPADASGHEHSGTFQIPVHQRGVEGGIKFKTRAGEEWESAKKAGRLQEVHTAERTIYYLPNELIELRLPESGFSGYMRWYDYETGMDPYYNEHAADSTNWVLSPRAADGSPFDAINTPQSAATYGVEGRSYGLYAVNKEHGGVLDEANPSNPAPQLRGWSKGGAHTIACDVSAYTDYTIWYNSTNTTRVDSIQEPTLSYRQLFHLKPAREIADKFDSLPANEYLEEYKYMAPAGKQVLLATEFRYKKYRSHESEMCYFYHGTDGKVHRITASTPVEWREDGNKISSPSYTAEMDYLIVRSNTPTTPNKKVYTLTLPAGAAGNEEELRIAKFEVEYVPLQACGPSTTTLISTQRINNNYESLANINFDNQDSHLPWGESSYGYVYSMGELAKTKYKRGANQGVFPFYGEYTIVSSVNKDWARQNAHSGKALYVDGTMEPGLVASIYTDAVICSGQTLTCSAWFCNPTPAGWNSEGNPIFRCNVQGRDSDNALWEDVGVYFVGELLKASGWQQVVFPIQSDKSYAQTRVSIYNFATTNLGNDFMVDDICLFVSPLPLTAYQGEMACHSTSDGGGAETTQAAAVLRLDYSNMDANTSPYVYYQIYNKEENAAVDLEDGGYYHDAHLGDSHGDDMLYGSVAIPTATYVPSVGKGDLIYQSVSKMLDDMSVKPVKSRKAYIKVVNDGVEKWLLYVAHMLENTSKQDENLTKLYYQDDYEMRMAFAADELSVAECNMQTPLHATKETVFTLRNANRVIADNIHTANDVACCPNMQYMLDAKIKNNFALGIGQLPNTYEAKVYADWLVGSEFDDPYTKGRPTDAEIAAADAAFKAKYGYTRGQVATAIMYDMRRLPTDDSPNSNYTAKSFKELNINHFLSRQNYTIIQHLHEKGLLELYKTTTSFYLSNEDTIRYWAYPIAETAKTTIMIAGKDSTVILQDCVEAKWVKAVSKDLDGYFLNIAPIRRANMTDEQKVMLPTYKVLKKNIDNAIMLPVTEVGPQPIKVGAQTISNEEDVISITLPETASSSTSVEIVDLATGNKIGRTSLVAGKEYHVNVSFTDGSGGNFGDCGGGTVTFILAVVPDVLVWTPSASSYNGWGKDENWRGWVDSDKDGVIDSGELVNGYVPMTGADVIIPTLSNAVRYPHIIEEHSHYPMAINYEAHNCSKIYFGPGAHFQNQHLLQYSKAYVDMVVPATKWNLMSTPLKEMYTGDFFVPHSGTYDKGGKSVEISDYFDVSEFHGTRAWNAAYAFWLSFYNQDVNVQNQSGSFVQNATTAEFVPSNSLVQQVAVGGGVSVLGYGPGDKEEDLVVRLPKSDTQYRYYGPEGQPTNTINVPTRANSNKLAYEPSKDVMSIKLTNKVASNKFVFGNPTMSNIDMNLFLADNKDVLTGNYYTLESSSWDSQTEVKGRRYLAPMRAVLLEAKSSGTLLRVSLKPSHTTLDNQVNRNVAPARISGRQEVGAADDWVDGVAKAEVMTIMGLVDDVCARVSIAVDPNADNAYYKGEDALFISSGVEAGVGTDVATSPVNMYTVAKSVPMMTDVRSEVSRVPLKVLVDTINYRSETMMLMFKLTSNWQKVCYFCDAVTGQKIRIYDEMIIQVEMPENHEERYYVEGPDPYNEGGDVTTSTTHPIEDNGANGVQMYVYPEGNGKLLVTSDGLIQSVVVYDMLGRVIASKEQVLLAHEVALEVPVGVCVVEAVMQNGSRQRARTIVK